MLVAVVVGGAPLLAFLDPHPIPVQVTDTKPTRTEGPPAPIRGRATPRQVVADEAHAAP